MEEQHRRHEKAFFAEGGKEGAARKCITNLTGLPTTEKLQRENRRKG